MPISRSFVGALLICMGVMIFLRMPTYSVAVDLARFVIVSTLTFAGTQVLLGRRLPGFQKRPRRVLP